MAREKPPRAERGSNKGVVHAERAARTGRKPLPVEDVRSGRLVQRAHPDLLDVIDQRARERGWTRSLFVESILIEHLNRYEGARLDRIGKWIPEESPDPDRGTKPPLRVGEKRQREYDVIETGFLEQSQDRSRRPLKDGEIPKAVRYSPKKKT